ncbi:hypothetical protein [Streptomyces nodosus]|uniref:Uncharacterized protein n=1 Tax=Streptomyces nodosus TaxID=40318 RepID=A0A0B5DTB7_9ACTN|nr:hypothetical protein [Streptomyces nodosus]AJE43342.1 hypothetical protein SNOD_27395 [Streptomyces nodosus]MBB4794774.1 hypothetical protein [Streptomyces nodosus]QEV41838.1 hypothetical protein CP978_27685 [Streptomyces nodosus]
MKPIEEIKELAQEFIDGRDRSMRLVGKIENILISEFLDADLYEKLTEAVSLYRPGEGLPYYSEQDMKEALEGALGIGPNS